SFRGYGRARGPGAFAGNSCRARPRGPGALRSLARPFDRRSYCAAAGSAGRRSETSAPHLDCARRGLCFRESARLMRRFYLRIYLALLASLAVFAILAGLTAAVLRFTENRPARSFPETAVELAERLLPADRDPALLASELAFWSERTGLSLAL